MKKIIILLALSSTVCFAEETPSDKIITLQDKYIENLKARFEQMYQMAKERAETVDRLLKHIKHQEDEIALWKKEVKLLKQMLKDKGVEFKDDPHPEED